MRLKNITIQNFRSITATEKLELSDYCILLGKNNEGKTNVLKAISFAMFALRQAKMGGRRPYRSENCYSFSRDYPVNLVDNPKSKPTKFVLSFCLNDEDKIDFYNTTSLHNNGIICFEIIFPKSDSPTENPEVTIKEKRGRGGDSYKKRLQSILSFLLSNISFQYIPAIRTTDDSLDVLKSLLTNVLSTLDEDEEYRKAIELIENKRITLVNELGIVVRDRIQTFIPSVSNVEISLGNTSDYDFDSVSRIKFIIDDGNKTSINYKGDGIKSLAALALLYRTKAVRQSQIIAIEEPESHLHYEAIHQIDAVLHDLSKTNQVIITTHNPIFINKNDVDANVIIDKGIGKKATSLNEIRELMGIRISDSLFYSDKVILVEGKDDVESLKTVFSLLSEELREAFLKNVISFSALEGASKLPYTCSLLSNWLVKYCVILDHDKAGIEAYNNSLSKGLIFTKNAFIPEAYDSKKENEFEDFINPSLYKDYLISEYGVSIECRSFKKKNKKWSDRLCEAFKDNGKLLDDSTKEKIKSDVSKIITKQTSIDMVLIDHYKEMFDSIAKALKQELL